MNMNIPKAFPTISLEFGGESDGMDLRDYFASQAMHLTYKYWMVDYYNPQNSDSDARCVDRDTDLCDVLEFIVDDAYKIADEMMKARE